MILQRLTRNRRLTPEEAATYREIREQIAEELPELIKRQEAPAHTSGARSRPSPATILTSEHHVTDELEQHSAKLETGARTWRSRSTS